MSDPTKNYRLVYNCHRKRIYATYADGKVAKAEMAAKGTDVRYLYPYRCPLGDHFHLGNSDEAHRKYIDKRLERKERRAKSERIGP